MSTKPLPCRQLFSPAVEADLKTASDFLFDKRVIVLSSQWMKNPLSNNYVAPCTPRGDKPKTGFVNVGLDPKYPGIIVVGFGKTKTYLFPGSPKSC